MEFWIFMLIMDLLTPAIMITAGFLFQKGAPKKINRFYGYRTERSMKNRETWEFAHRHCGKLWLRGGLIMLPFSVLPLLFLMKSSIEFIGVIGIVICTVQMIAMLALLYLTETALKQNFDTNGNRIKKI